MFLKLTSRRGVSRHHVFSLSASVGSLRCASPQCHAAKALMRRFEKAANLTTACSSSAAQDKMVGMVKFGGDLVSHGHWLNSTSKPLLPYQWCYMSPRSSTLAFVQGPHKWCPPCVVTAVRSYCRVTDFHGRAQVCARETIMA
eukprot:5812047-Amphidinium_carterae.1